MFEDLPYRPLLAVATKTDVVFFDLQQKHAISRSGRMHCEDLTDVAW